MGKPTKQQKLLKICLHLKPTKVYKVETINCRKCSTNTNTTGYRTRTIDHRLNDIAAMVLWVVEGKCLNNILHTLRTHKFFGIV